ncbi:MAG: hypothetical protein J5623_01980 [Clostridiales bacterium]|nr:hypothetical protein [Clostridiales bacterium]
MKRVFVAIAVLIGLHIVALGTLCAVFPMNFQYDNTYGKDTEVESFEFYVGGGLSGGFHYKAKVWRDAMGYHLYYKNQRGFEDTFSLTKFEYLMCADLRQEDVDEMVAYEGSRISDGFMTVVRIKFKGKDEIEIPRKCYDASKFEIPIDSVLDIAEFKMAHLDNDYFVKLNRQICGYQLKYGVPFSTFSYRKYYESSSSTMKRISFYKGVSGRRSSEELNEFINECISNRFFSEDRPSASHDFMTKDSTVVSLHGHKAYMKAKESGGIAYIFISSSERETVEIYAPVPEGMTFEEYKQDVCKILNDANNGYLLGNAVLAETAALFAASLVTAVVLYCVREKSSES